MACNGAAIDSPFRDASNPFLEPGTDDVLLVFNEGGRVAMETILRPNNLKFLEQKLSEMLGSSATLKCELQGLN
jgi:hypothetical protein